MVFKKKEVAVKAPAKGGFVPFWAKKTTTKVVAAKKAPAKWAKAPAKGKARTY